MDEMIRQVSRREFLQGLAFAAGLSLVGAVASACAPMAPSIDSEYLALDRRQRLVSLLGGRIPASWKNLAPEELLPRLEGEVASVVLPEVCARLGAEAQDIVGHLEYYTDQARLLELVQKYGESNEALATQVAKESIGVTLSRFNEQKTVPDKQIAINLGKIREIGQAEVIKAKLADPKGPEGKAVFNTYVVQSVVDAVIHEATHYIMEVDRLPEKGDLERLQSMYAEGAIGTVEIQGLLYYEGVQVAILSRGGYKYYLNKALTEIVRAYVMQRLIDEMEAGLPNPPEKFRDSAYLIDTATNQVMDFLHTEMGFKIPSPPLAAFKNDLLRIIDYYQERATVGTQGTARQLHMVDRDFVRIFGLMESMYGAIGSAVALAGGRDVPTAEMVYRAKLEIEKVIIEARRRS
jgi:hypothetical protein